MRSLTPCCLFLLFLSLFLTPTAHARTWTPDAVKQEVIKRGVSNPVAILEKNGLELYGKILAIGPDSFQMQVLYAPQATEVFYADVQDLRTGFRTWSTGEKTFLFVSIGAMAGFTIWAAVHFVNVRNNDRDKYNQQCAINFGGVCPNPATSPHALQFHWGK